MIRCLKSISSHRLYLMGWEGMAWKETGNSYKEMCQTKVLSKTDETRQEEHQSTLNKLRKKLESELAAAREREKKNRFLSEGKVEGEKKQHEGERNCVAITEWEEESKCESKKGVEIKCSKHREKETPRGEKRKSE